MNLLQATPLLFRQNYRPNFFSHIAFKKIGELFFVRHAESDHNANGCCAGWYNRSSPTADGIEQTRTAAKLLAASGVKFDKLYVSPLHRALMTAEIILNDLPHVPMIISDALAERNFGAFTGMSKKNIEKMIGAAINHKYLHDKYFFPPNIAPGHKYYQSEEMHGTWPDNHQSESYQCVINRLMPLLDATKKELLDGKNILIVGHSRNLQLFQMLLYNKLFEQGIEQYKLEHASPVKYTLSLNSDGTLTIKDKIDLNSESMFRSDFQRSCIDTKNLGPGAV